MKYDCRIDSEGSKSEFFNFRFSLFDRIAIFLFYRYRNDYFCTTVFDWSFVNQGR